MDRPRSRGEKREILNVREDATRRWDTLSHLIARTARLLSHPLFLAGELIFHVGWVACNVGLVAGVSPWDPYPFSLLTGVASVQALFIGLLILVYEERSARVDELREETNLQVSLHAERETTKLIQMVHEVHGALGLTTADRDPAVAEMEQTLDPHSLRDRMEERMDRHD